MSVSFVMGMVTGACIFMLVVLTGAHLLVMTIRAVCGG